MITHIRAIKFNHIRTAINFDSFISAFPEFYFLVYSHSRQKSIGCSTKISLYILEWVAYYVFNAT